MQKNDTRKQLIPEYKQFKAHKKTECKQFKAEENQLEIQLWVETERERENLLKIDV